MADIKVEVPCPHCGTVVRGLRRRAGTDVLDGDIIVCYGCCRPSVWSVVAGTLTVPSAEVADGILREHAALVVITEAMARDWYGLAGLFDRAVWPDGVSQEWLAAQCPDCASRDRATILAVLDWNGCPAYCDNDWHRKCGPS